MNFDVSRLYLPICVSVALHLALFWGFSSRRQPSVKTAYKPVEFKIQTPPTPLPAEPKPKPEPPKPKKVVDLTKPITPKPPIPTPTPPAAEPPKTSAKPVPAASGVSEKSTTTGESSVTAPVGNTTLGDPTQNPKTPPPKQAPSGQGPPGAPMGPVSVAQVSKLPQKQGECPPFDPRTLYTEAAKEQGVEGKVVLEVIVDESGRVTQAKVIKGLGFGLDEAAVKVMKQLCRFLPAEMNGQKVAVKIPYSFIFTLEE